MDATTTAIVANKRAAVLQLTERLLELDAMPADTAASATFTLGRQSYDWNGYRASLVQQIEALERSIETTIKADSLVNGPWEAIEVVRG